MIDKAVYQSNIVPSASVVDRCVSCGICTRHCPQNLDIPVLLNKVHGEFMEYTYPAKR